MNDEAKYALSALLVGGFIAWLLASHSFPGTSPRASLTQTGQTALNGPEAFIASMVALYGEADEDPAKGRQLMDELCKSVEGGVYSDKQILGRPGVSCKSDSLEFFLWFSPSNGKVVSSWTWYRPPQWSDTVEVINKMTGKDYVEDDGMYLWTGPKDDEGWWPELGVERLRGGTHAIFGWTNKVR